MDSACTDDHLKKLGLKLSDWRVVAMLLGLEDSEIKDIQQKGESTVERAILMLRKWRQSRGEQATYRCLASVFGDIGRTDLVEKIREVVEFPTPPTPALAQSQSTTLQKHTNHLKSLYQAHRPAAIVQTLPPPTDKYFNLVLIKKRRTEPPPDEEILHSIVQEGNANRVGIKLDDIFEIDEAARKVILIEGAPGSGKTTLSWHICQKWASGKLFQQFSLVVLVSLRDPAIQSAAAITDLLPCTSDKSAMLEIQSQEGEGILFVMDGWDELATNAQQESAVRQLVQSSLANPFPKSTVVVTCRSESSGQLQELVSSRIETMGFTPSDVKEYFSECLKGDSQAVEKLSDAVKQNPQIEASCYLPLNAAIIVAIFLMTPNSKLPTTLHELFTTLVLTCILYHLQSRTQYKAVHSLASLDTLPHSIQLSLDHLCELAFNGIEKNKLSFSAEELGSSSDFDTMSLVQGVQSFTFCGLSIGVSKIYSFLHLSIQELLAARHISKLPLNKQVRIFHELIDHPRFTAVFRFFAGITRLENERIAKLFLKMGESSEYDPHGQDYVPLDVLQERYQYLYITQPSLEWSYLRLSQLCHVDTRLLLFNCLYEARNPDLYHSLAILCGNTHRNPPLLHLHGTSMSTYDYLSVGYFLPWVHRTVSSEISVQLDLINDTCAKFMVKGLTEGIRETRSCGHGSVDMYTGSLSIQLVCSAWKHESMYYLTQLLQSSEGIYISRLLLVQCQLAHQDFLCLAEAVGSSRSLKVLELVDTSLMKESKLVLCTMLRRNTSLKTLRIANFEDTETITDIAVGLIHNRVLETVQFTVYINKKEVKALAEIIYYNKKLKTLMINKTICSLLVESDGMFHVIEALKHNRTLQNLYMPALGVQELELMANTLTINTTLEKLDYQFLSTTKLSALAKRLWTSGVLCQLLTIAIERTVEWFGEEETIKALGAILLEWNLSK